MRTAAQIGAILSIFLFVCGNIGFAQCFGDFNCDGHIDGGDLSKFALGFGETNCGGDLYVDGTTGQDLPSNGVSADIPFKTITYAFRNLSCCCGTTIHIAPGTYSENITIDKDKITLKKMDGTSGDAIVDGGSQDVITIVSARSVSIMGLVIQNGNIGIAAKVGSSLKIVDTIVQDSSNTGLRIGETSTAEVTDFTVRRSGNWGILVFNNSNATFKGTINSEENVNAGFYIANGSSALFSAATCKAINNNQAGIAVSNSSSIFSLNSTVATRGNNYDGVAISFGSDLLLAGNDTWLSEKNANRGVTIQIGSSLTILDQLSTLTVKDNDYFGIQIVIGSSFYLFGNLNVESNVDVGLIVNYASSVGFESGILNVKGTKNMGVGVWVAENSSLNSYGGTLTIENNDSDGIRVLRNANIRLAGPALLAQIRNNGENGVNILKNSNADLFKGTSISGNTSDGLVVNGNSALSVSEILVQNNTGKGIFADDGSTANCSNSTINGNVGGDIVLSFGSRATLKGNTIGSTPITCDNTVLSRGDTVCP